MIDWSTVFSRGLTYDKFLDTYASPTDHKRWTDLYRQFTPHSPQKALLASFVRDMNVLCLAGAWCGDCVSQCPILEHFARQAPKIKLRFIDRDAEPEVAAELKVCGGARVPVAVFLSEEFAECARFGDRTLARYRAMAGELSGAACSTGITSDDALQAVAADWLREFERVQLMLRLSPRLRRKHGD